MPDTSAVQAETLQRFLEAWKRWNAEDWLNLFADDFTQITLPAALGIPARSRQQVEVMLPALMATVKSYEVTIHHAVHEPEKNTAAVYASSTGNVPWGPWQMEYAVFLTFNKTGDKIDVLEEMLDSSTLQEFGPKFGQYLEQNGGPVAVAAAAH